MRIESAIELHNETKCITNIDKPNYTLIDNFIYQPNNLHYNAKQFSEVEALCVLASELRSIVDESRQGQSTKREYFKNIRVNIEPKPFNNKNYLELAKIFAKFNYIQDCYKNAKKYAESLFLSTSLKADNFCQTISTIDNLEKLAFSIWPHSLPTSCKPILPTFNNYNQIANQKWWAKAEVACRVDLAGGWTDTPPITYECSNSAVLNVSIKVDGKKPIRCHCRRLESNEGVYIVSGKLFNKNSVTIHFPNGSNVAKSFALPCIPGSLICTILLISGFVLKHSFCDDTTERFNLNMNGVGRGLFIQCESDLPHGSGLGTSSILSTAILACLWKLQGKPFSNSDLVQAVLKVEQLHTVGGGWQDQVGGIIDGGFKLASINVKSVNKEVIWSVINISENFCLKIRQRLILIYTGTTRLAKNLLQQVVLRWLRKEADVLLTVDNLAADARKASNLIQNSQFPSEICEQYNMLKKLFTNDSEPALVGRLRQLLVSLKLADASWVAGAGGGGFLYVWLKEDKTLNDVNTFLFSKEWIKESGKRMYASAIEVDFKPLQLQY